MTTAKRYTERELDRAIRSTQEPQLTPEQVREGWLECTDTDVEEDLAYSIGGPVVGVVLAILLAVLAFGALIAMDVVADPGLMP